MGAQPITLVTLCRWKVGGKSGRKLCPSAGTYYFPDVIALVNCKMGVNLKYLSRSVSGLLTGWNNGGDGIRKKREGVKKYEEEGFTLIELLVVIAVIAICRSITSSIARARRGEEAQL